MARRRLDLELVRRSLAPSRSEAQRLIAAGLVTVGGAPAANAARQVDPGEPVVVLGPPARFVSRGGEKLDAALESFAVEVRDRRVLDAGASTGGFSDCVLQRGARWVAAVDVGHGQLHPKLRDDPRVMVRERCNVRDLTAQMLIGPGEVRGPVEVVVADLSFISLRVVLDALLACVVPDGDLVMLVKPQFEAGRREVSKGKGIISDPEVWERVRSEVCGAITERGAAIMGWMRSPLTGADGNVEFLVHARARVERLDGVTGPGSGNRRVALMVHTEREEASALARRAAALLERAGVEVVMPAGDAEASGMRAASASDDACCSAEFAVSLGGDGTMLRTVALVAEAGVPVLGVNVGMLGYLAEVEPDALDDSLTSVLAGRHLVEERMMLSVDVVLTATGAATRRAVGLNEVVVEKLEAGHTARMHPYINGSPFTPYAADGLIVATATGSTAYALSARGPIVSPTLRALLLTPVSPHMLFDRSLVLGPDEVVRIELEGHRPATVSVDGRHVADLIPGDSVECRAALFSARLVRFGRLDFHRRLKAKFQLADR